MSPVTIIWSMIASACLTLAGIHLMVWFYNRKLWDRMALVLMTLATAWMARVELRMMKAPTPELFATALRWQHPPILLIFVTIVAFVRLHLRAGRLWLAWLAVGARSVSLVANFTTGEALNFRVVTGLRQEPYLGDEVTLPVGVINPWMFAGQAGLLLLVIFVIEASVTAWRRGEKQRAVLAGASIAIFALLGTAQAILSYWHNVPVPAVASLYFMGTIMTMAFDLSLDTLRAGKLAEELQMTRETSRKEVAHLGRVAAMGDLSVSLAHEMNQPLGIILTNAQAAQRLLAKEAPDLEKVNDILNDIVREDLRAGEVIKRMRTMLKRGEVRHQPLEVNEVMEEVLQLMRNSFHEHGVRLEQELAPGLPLVSADRVQLQQVFLNLALNACEAMTDSPPENRKFRATTGSDGKAVRIMVSDTGRGLPAEVESIFEPFFTTKESGLGMGLAICRSIITAHHGQLWAERNEPHGATFCIVLPAAEVS